MILLFNRFKKNKKEKEAVELSAPVTGTFINITEVEDPVFSQKMMGDGFAVKPFDKEIYSPIEGTVTSVFPTKHAIGFITTNGVEGLVHMGLDTVDLDGRPFTVCVNEGDTITSDTKLALVDLDMLKTENKSSDIIVVFTNLSEMNQQLEFLGKTDVSQGDIVGKMRQ